MSYPINYPTPQGANVQIFQCSGTPTAVNRSTWIKPQGASFVWFTLIGSGGAGNGTTGGGSGAVTNFMCPAFLIPDQLQITPGSRTNTTDVRYKQKDGTGYLLLSAPSANGITGGSVMDPNYFTAMGFFQSVAGQNGSSGSIAASSTTFLSGGCSAAGSQASNYGYSSGGASSTGNGFFMMQPIIVGVSAKGTGAGGIGCGGGVAATPSGGDGLVVIITW